MWTGSFWKATAERVISSFVATLLGAFGGAETLDVHAYKWAAIFTAAGIAAAFTLAKCILAVNIGPKGSPSLVADPAAAGKAPLEAVPAPKVGGYPGGAGPVGPPDQP